MRRACLTGKDIADIINGGMISVSDVEFIYDGLGMADIQRAIKALEQRTEGSKTEQKRVEAKRPGTESLRPKLSAV